MNLRIPFAITLLILLWPISAGAVEVKRVVSPGGIEAWLVEDHSNPIISLDLAFRGSAALDPAGKAGLAHMVASTIDEGAGDLDSQSFQGQLDNLSIRLSFDAGLDQFSGSVRTLTENRDTAFDMLRLALSQPRFDEEPVERIRAQILTGLSREAQDPNSIVRKTIRKLFFPEHAYGEPVGGTPESVAGLTVNDLRGFVAQRFGRDRLVIGVVGDILPKDLARLLDETFMVLPAKAAPVGLVEVEPSGNGELIVIEKDIPQSVVAFGHGGIKRDDPDYYVAYVVNYVLGGGSFSSRLYEEVREKRGLAYSVYSYLGPMDFSAVVMGGVATQNARVAESLQLIRQEWRRMAEKGPTAKELSDAKIYLTGSFPLRLTSTGAVAGMLVGMQLAELGIDYLDRRNDFIEAVSLEDARRVARRIYQADDLSVVVVGQPEGVTPTRAVPDGKG
jgi:zinc protease